MMEISEGAKLKNYPSAYDELMDNYVIYHKLAASISVTV